MDTSFDWCSQKIHSFLFYYKKEKRVNSMLYISNMAYFGALFKFHSDCGWEFASNVFHEMNEKLGIETSTTLRESLFANAVVEISKVLHEALLKTMKL